MRIKRVNIFVSIILIAAAFALTLPLFFRAEEVKAATPVTATKVLPVSDMELTALSSPQNVFCLGNTIAIIENSTTLTVFKNGTKIVSAVTFTDLGTIKVIDENTLYVSDNGSIYRLSISNGEINGKTALQNAATTPPENIGSDFDYNGNYLITNNAFTIITYSLNETSATQEEEFSSKNKSPIAINDNDTIFYVDIDSNLCKSDIKHNITQTLISSTAITKMIANEEYVYYIEGTSVYRVSVNGGEPQNLIPDKWFNEGEIYDLGKLGSPTGLCFRNGNLLISDSSINAVQEFKIVNDKLEFTGFAIAQSEKTAYNRIGKAKKLDRYGNRVAALSDKKLTVMTVDDAFDGYDKANFKNYFVNATTMPTNFALGKTSLVAVVGVKNVTYINLDDGTNKPLEFTDGEGAIKDVTYQSGTFYILTHNGVDYKLFSADEKDFSCDEKKFTVTSAGNSLAVDVFGKETTSTEFSDLATDLAGNVYGLKFDGKIYKNGVETGLDGVKAFAMDFDEKSVYYADGNAEYLYVTENLGNLAISSLTLPDGYALKGESAKRVASYKIKDEKSNAYVFETTDNNGVNFKDLADGTQTNEYILLGKRNMGDNTVMAFLAGENGAIIADERHLAELQPDELTVDKDVYITTGVRAYYLPIITQNNLYTVIRNGNDVNFSKNDCVRAKSKTTFFGRDFYFVGTTVNGETFDCYVPVDFTVDELSKDYKYETFTIENVNKTDVFSDEAMTVKAAELNKGTQVRVISNSGDTIKIAYLSGEEWTVGFINSSAIIDEGKTAVRNVLIVLAVITCACGSLTYFILRKRK